MLPSFTIPQERSEDKFCAGWEETPLSATFFVLKKERKGDRKVSTSGVLQGHERVCVLDLLSNVLKLLADCVAHLLRALDDVCMQHHQSHF